MSLTETIQNTLGANLSAKLSVSEEDEHGGVTVRPVEAGDTDTVAEASTALEEAELNVLFARSTTDPYLYVRLSV